MTEKYHIFHRLLHWVMAVCIIGLIAVGYLMEGMGKDDVLLGLGKYDWYGWHKSFGVLVIILFIFRILTKLFTTTPKPSDKISKLDAVLSKLGHFGLYVLMIAVPMSGVVMSQAGGHPIKFFGLDVPVIFAEDKALGGSAHELHWILAYIIGGLVIIHILAVVKHYFFDKVNLLKRMT